jgi:hypothetical protein
MFTEERSETFIATEVHEIFWGFQASQPVKSSTSHDLTTGQNMLSMNREL